MVFHTFDAQRCCRTIIVPSRHESGENIIQVTRKGVTECGLCRHLWSVARDAIPRYVQARKLLYCKPEMFNFDVNVCDTGFYKEQSCNALMCNVVSDFCRE